VKGADRFIQKNNQRTWGIELDFFRVFRLFPTMADLRRGFLELLFLQSVNGYEFFNRKQRREQRGFIHRILCSLRCLLFLKFLLA